MDEIENIKKLLSDIKQVERKLDLLNSEIQIQEEKLKNIQNQRLIIKKYKAKYVKKM